MNRIKNILYVVVMATAILFAICALACVPKAHGQSERRFEFVETSSSPPSYNEDILFARGDSLFVKLQDGREIFTGETQKDGNGYFSIFPERAYFLMDSIRKATALKYLTVPITTLELNSWQGLDSIKAYGWVTDSIKWVPIDTTLEGDRCHVHDWVYSESYKITVRIGDMVYLKNPYDPSLGRFLVCIAGYHPRNLISDNVIPIHDEDEHCPYEVLEREKICRKCMRSIIEREKWFQHYVAPPKTEFQRLKEKQRDQYER